MVPSLHKRKKYEQEQADCLFSIKWAALLLQIAVQYAIIKINNPLR